MNGKSACGRVSGKRLQKMKCSEARTKRNDLQSVVRRATCEWREGVQHGSMNEGRMNAGANYVEVWQIK